MSMREECGVFGVYSTAREDVASLVHYGLYALQHRGQEGCGIEKLESASSLVLMASTIDS